MLRDNEQSAWNYQWDIVPSIFLDFLEEVYKKLDEGRVENVVGLYLDIAKAVQWR